MTKETIKILLSVDGDTAKELLAAKEYSTYLTMVYQLCYLVQNIGYQLSISHLQFIFNNESHELHNTLIPLSYKLGLK